VLYLWKLKLEAAYTMKRAASMSIDLIITKINIDKCSSFHNKPLTINA